MKREKGTSEEEVRVRAKAKERERVWKVKERISVDNERDKGIMNTRDKTGRLEKKKTTMLKIEAVHKIETGRQWNEENKRGKKKESKLSDNDKVMICKAAAL